ncbi:TetR/AcrR family transcriptional regulator [Leifsonia poae]|uniref:TetR/AcrR family transcriptional regulator n=1 Tax=Leifsonia poae TaxID=110933 RepID=UPI001CBB885F|nr:TetR family transcriptional regulator [Leifsonia poae]
MAATADAGPGPRTEPRRSARGLARREQILDAAGALFAEGGFAGVSLREIAARAELSHPGLLRHFASKDEVLLELLHRHEAATGAWLAEQSFSPSDNAERIVRIAERNVAIPGYVELFTALAGEATSPAHPAHDYFARRYSGLRRSSPAGAADARLAAAWDGLQLQSLYDPARVDVAERLRAHLAPAGTQPATRAATRPAPTGVDPVRGEARRDVRSDVRSRGGTGYAAGRARRERIIDDATTLFAAGGFTATSLQDIADRVGVTKSTLLYHFASKDDLLLAVLRRRDDLSIASLPETGFTARDLLDPMVDGARRNATQPGLVELYSVLAGEATSSDHPGHDFFRERFRGMRHLLTDAFAELAGTGALPTTIDPDQEAVWFLALWDGLQLQWLYDRTAVDVADQLRAHLVALASR